MLKFLVMVMVMVTKKYCVSRNLGIQESWRLTEFPIFASNPQMFLPSSANLQIFQQIFLQTFQTQTRNVQCMTFTFRLQNENIKGGIKQCFQLLPQFVSPCTNVHLPLTAKRKPTMMRQWSTIVDKEKILKSWLRELDRIVETIS